MSIENVLRPIPSGTYKRAEKGEMTKRDFDTLDEIIEGCEQIQNLSTNFNMVLGKYLNDVEQEGTEKRSLVDFSVAFDDMVRLTDHSNSLLGGCTFCMKRNREERRKKVVTS